MEGKRFLSVKEASKYSSLSQRFLYEIVARREIKSYKIHRRIVLDIRDLEDYIKYHARESVNWDERIEELTK